MNSISSMSILDTSKSSASETDSLVSIISLKIQSINNEIDSLQVIFAHQNAKFESGNFWLYLITICALVLTFISSIISLYLYKWRKILLDGNQVFQPEDWVNDVRKVNLSLGELLSTFGGSFKKISHLLIENTQTLESMKEMYISMHQVLDDKDKEIQRYKQGYDTILIKKFIFKFVRVEQAIQEITKENDTVSENEIKLVHRLLEDALDECGVEKFTPKIGSDSTTYNGLEPISEKEPTQDPENEFRVFKVIEPGYRLKQGETYDIIQPAKVKIYELIK